MRAARKMSLPFEHQCKLAGLPYPVAEYAFAKATERRRWRVDWCFIEARVALEVEGGYASRGRHTRLTGFLGDMEKYNSLACHGYRLLRVTPRQVANGEALTWVTRILAGLPTTAATNRFLVDVRRLSKDRQRRLLGL